MRTAPNFQKEVINNVRSYGFIAERTRTMFKNRDELIEKLTDILIDFDTGYNDCETDVYIRCDTENHTAEISTDFVKDGRKNMKYYILYTDKPHDIISKYWTTIEQIVEDLDDVSEEDLRIEVAEFLELEEDEIEEYQLQYNDLIAYVRENLMYFEMLMSLHEDFANDNREEYQKQAEKIISDFEDNYFKKQ